MQAFKIFVLHVKKGYEERAAHIEKMMARLGLEFEYISDGDIADLNPEIMQRWFDPDGELGKPSAVTSCSCKHLFACKAVVERQLPGAIILEDDILLSDNFADIVAKSISQLPEGRPAIVSYEDTRLRFVPHSMRKPGQVIYPGDRDRFAGAYYVNAEGAAAILDSAATDRLKVPIDLYHRHMLDAGKIQYWWSHPCVASQGSFNGLFTSTLTPDRGKALVWKLKRAYRRLLYRLR